MPPDKDHCFNTGPCEGQVWLKSFQSLSCFSSQSLSIFFRHSNDDYLAWFWAVLSSGKGMLTPPPNTGEQLKSALIQCFSSYFWESGNNCPAFIGCSLWEKQDPLCSIYFTETLCEFLDQNTSAILPQVLFSGPFFHHWNFYLMSNWNVNTVPWASEALALSHLILSTGIKEFYWSSCLFCPLTLTTEPNQFTCHFRYSTSPI